MKKSLQLIAFILVALTTGFCQSPVLLNDINVGSNSSSSKNFLNYNGDLYFLARSSNSVQTSKMYKGLGDNLLDVSQSINDATLGSSPFPDAVTFMLVFNDSLYFSSNSKLYRTNGVDEVHEVNINGAEIYGEMIGYKDRLYFSGNTQSRGNGLYSYSPGIANPRFITGLNDTDVDLAVANNLLFFKAENQNRWFRFSGVGSPAILTGTSFRNMFDYQVYKDKLYFSAETTVSAGSFSRDEYQLFETDGISNPKVVNGLEFFFNVYEIGVYKNELVFDGDLVTFNSSDSYLTFYDGTSFNRITRNYFQSRSFVENNDTLFFNASTGTDFELWRYVEGGTPEQVVNLNLSGNSSPQNLFSYNDNLIFTADDGVNGRELWALGPDYMGTPTGLFNLERETLSIYPNPANYIIYTEIGQLEILDSTGNLVLSIQSNGQVDVSGLKSGVYVVKQNGKKTKLIIN